MKLIFMGSQALAEGFALLGFETINNATTATVETVLAKLLSDKAQALIFLEAHLAAKPGPIFLQARTQASGIIITEIPSLNQPENYRPPVEDLVAKVLGPSALDKSP
jgi:vacuolar-type H+-ATPase subunit F/Vma7